MKSSAKTVGEYLKEVPAARTSALKKLRALCRRLLPGYKESMAWGMPSYKKGDDVEVAFSSQKQHICVYFLKHDVMLSNKKLLEGLNHGKGCIRYSNPDKMDFGILEKLLKDTVSSPGNPC